MSDIIKNFKQLLKNNFYSKDEECDEFLRWLQLSTTYENGTVEINEEKIITESEIPASQGDDTLKNLVKEWARIKPVKQENWNIEVDKNIAYYNGVVYFYPTDYTIIKQKLTVNVSYVNYINSHYIYAVSINVTPLKRGQVATINGKHFQVFDTSDTVSVQINSTEKINEFKINVFPQDSGGKLYTGGIKIYTL